MPVGPELIYDRVIEFHHRIAQIRAGNSAGIAQSLRVQLEDCTIRRQLDGNEGALLITATRQFRRTIPGAGLKKSFSRRMLLLRSFVRESFTSS
jgi:hypothetical protein